MEEISVTLKKGINTFLFKLDRDGCIARIIPEPDSSFKGNVYNITTSEPLPHKKISTIGQLRQWAMEKETENSFTGSTQNELNKWQKDFRTYYHQCLGPFPDIPDGETELVSAEITEQGIERRLYHMPSEAGCILPFYIMIPSDDIKNGKVITVAHGHRMQWKTVAGAEPPPSPRVSATGPVTADYAYQLACKGFVTSVCCERGFSDRDDYKGSWDKCTYAYLLSMAQGFLYPTLHMHDVRRMNEFVMSLPETNGMKGPGLTGLSGGGTLTYLLGAYDDTFKACAVWCGMCRYRDYTVGGGCGMQVVPLLWPRGDVGELLSLIAPRPLLVGQGKYDATFNVVTVRSIAEDAQRAYEAAGCSEKFRIHIPDLGHQVDMEECARFFEETLV